MQTTTNGIPALTDTAQAHLHPSSFSPRTLSILVALVLPVINLASSNCNARTVRVFLCTLQAAHLEVSLDTSQTYSTAAGAGDENREGRKLERLAELQAHNSISMSPQGAHGISTTLPISLHHQAVRVKRNDQRGRSGGQRGRPHHHLTVTRAYRFWLSRLGVGC
ncbi:hypothetical protein M405DRAFT_137617 [Rhizopogon salebrosus TDB-379]|nr:hypothetical protein M405DRAFT_137617 [Rhizopogon salebrosus TDB-379]